MRRPQTRVPEHDLLTTSANVDISLADVPDSACQCEPTAHNPSNVASCCPWCSSRERKNRRRGTAPSAASSVSISRPSSRSRRRVAGIGVFATALGIARMSRPRNPRTRPMNGLGPPTHVPDAIGRLLSSEELDVGCSLHGTGDTWHHGKLSSTHFVGCSNGGVVKILRSAFSTLKLTLTDFIAPLVKPQLVEKRCLASNVKVAAAAFASCCPCRCCCRYCSDCAAEVPSKTVLC